MRAGGGVSMSAPNSRSARIQSAQRISPIDVAAVAVGDVDCNRGDRGRESREPARALAAERGDRRHRAGPIHQREALLAQQVQRLEPEFGERLGRRHDASAQRHLALAEQRGREVGERREVAARSHGALFGDAGQQARVDEIAQPLEQLGAHPRVPLGERDEPNHHDRGRLGLVEDSARAAAVKAHQVDGEVAAQVRGDRGLRAGADTSGYAVHGDAVGIGALHGGARLRELFAVARVAVESDAPLAPGDREHVRDRQPVAPDHRRSAGIGGSRRRV